MQNQQDSTFQFWPMKSDIIFIIDRGNYDKHNEKSSLLRSLLILPLDYLILPLDCLSSEFSETPSVDMLAEFSESRILEA